MSVPVKYGCPLSHLPRSGLLFFVEATQENEAMLHTLLGLLGAGVLYADRETTEVYANELTLVSRDEHFDKLPQVIRA